MDTPLQTPGPGSPREAGVPKELNRKFSLARAHIRAMSTTKGLALLVFAALATFALAIVLDRIFYLPKVFRVVVFAGTLGVLIGCAVMYLALPLLRRYSARQIALSVEDRHPQLGDIVVSTVELSESRATGQLQTSGQLVDALTRETLKRTEKVDFRSVAPFSAVRLSLVLAIVLVAVVGTAWVADPKVVGNVFARVFNPTADIDPYTHTKLAVEPGDHAVPKGSDVEIEATAAGRVPTRAGLAWRAQGRHWNRERIAGDEENTYRYTLKNVLRPIVYRLRAGDARTKTFSIVPIEAPAIIDLDILYTYPDYTGLGEQPGPVTGGNIAVLRGTKATITATATKPVKSAWVTLKYTDDPTMTAPADEETPSDDKAVKADEPEIVIPLEVNGDTIGPLALDIKREATYTFHLRDKYDFANSPVAYVIKPLRDGNPEIDVTAPEMSIKRTVDMPVPIRFVARDDYGLTALRLAYTISTGERKEKKDVLAEDEVKGELPIEMSATGRTELAAEYMFDLSTLGVVSGMEVRYHLEIEDNYREQLADGTYAGPNSGRSTERVIHVISDRDAFKQIEEEQAALQRRLKKLIQQQEKNKKLTEQIELDVAKTDATTPAQAEQLDNARRAEETITESTKQLARDFDPTMEKMEENPLIQPSSLMRMQEMKTALEALARGDMPRATSQLSSAGETSQPDERGNRLQQAEKTEQDIITALKRIDEEFSTLQEEQLLLSIAGTADRMRREQEKNMTGTTEAGRDFMGHTPEQLDRDQKRRLQKLVDRQRKLQEDTDALMDELERARKVLEYKRSKDAEAVEDAMNMLDQGGTKDAMKQAEDDLQLSRLNKSMGNQSKAAKTLQQIANRLKQAQRNRFAGEHENAEEQMQGHVAELERIIEIQKQIIAATEQQPGGAELSEADAAIIAALIRNYGVIEDTQGRLHVRTGEFADLIEAMFGQIIIVGIDPVTPLRAAVNSMRDAHDQLSQLRREEALADEQRALEALIDANDQLSEALARMMAEAQMNQMRQQINILAELIEKQRKINEDTKETDAARPPTDDLSPAFRRLIEGIGGRQGRLGDQVKQLGQMLRPLVKIGDKMGEVSELLKELRSGKETQQKQEEILNALESLMLQIQQQMQSLMAGMGMGAGGMGGGGNLDPTNLGARLRELSGGTIAELHLPERLQRELLQAWSEKYPESFRDLLSLYYSRLSEEENPY